MLKWVGRILYVIFLFVLTIQIFSFSYYSKLQTYYDNLVRTHIDNDDFYVEGIHTLMQTDYFKKDPLYIKLFNDDQNFQAQLSIYAISATQSGERHDGLMLFVNQVVVYEEGKLIENPIIKITANLSDKTLKVNDELTDEGTIQFDPSQPFAFYNVPMLFLFDTENYLKIPDSDDFASILSITAFYSNGSIDDKNRYVYSTQPLFVVSRDTVSEAVLGNNKVEDFELDPSDYQFRHIFEGKNPTQAEIDLLGLFTERGNVDKYNYVIWRTMGIYALVVALFTYFIFFHKIFREKKEIQKAKLRAESAPPQQEVIFRDVPEQKNGKK